MQALRQNGIAQCYSRELHSGQLAHSLHDLAALESNGKLEFLPN